MDGETREQEVGVEKIDAQIAEFVGIDELVDSVDGDGNVGRLPKFDCIFRYPVSWQSDKFDAGLIGKFDDVFGGPIWILIKSIDDGFPGVDCHDCIEHFGVVNLDDKAIKDR